MLVTTAIGARAGEIWRWTDADGTRHYADRPTPDARSPRRTADSAPAAIARLRLEQGDGELLAWAQNPLDGPIEVLLRVSGAAPQAVPALPARATVPARTEVLLTRIAGQGAAAQLALTAVPGHPGARPRDVEYGYPLGTRQLRVEQGWSGGFSHSDAQNRHAVDFAAAVGTPVLAARDGTVMHAEAGFDEAAPGDHEAVTRANFVRVLHDDGSMALYAHLDAGGVLVHPGQRVRRGTPLGRSGNTGLSSGPHLHFVVQVNRGLSLESIPFRMFGPQGILRFQP
ncbi:peptidase [Lysobacteraceae bacterium NML91-0213]|nr:peptidase [Xanthomonadaceae bacterium NML91-0213]